MSVTTQQQNPLVEFRRDLMAMTPEFANALPSHIKPEKFQRVVMTVVQLQPELLRADRRSLFGSCVKCAADGLVPDGREAALVMFGGKVQYMPMFTGIQKRVRNSGEIASIQAHVIYENDEFVWQQGVDGGVVHKPLFPGDRGKPIGAYAIAKFKDGSDPQIEVMDISAIERVRKVSRAANNGPWAQWWDEMARKTVFRRLAKWLPLDAETDVLFRRDDEAGTPTIAEPSGVVLEGQVQESDDFEMASRGVQQGMAPSEDHRLASLSETGRAFLSEFLALDNLQDIQAQEANPEVKAAARKLPKEDQASITVAIEAHKNGLRMAA